MLTYFNISERVRCRDVPSCRAVPSCVTEIRWVSKFFFSEKLKNTKLKVSWSWVTSFWINFSNNQENVNGKQLVGQLDFQKFTIVSGTDPTFLSSNGSSNFDFLIVSKPIEQNFSAIKPDSEIELFSGAPLRGHIPILTTFKLDRDLGKQPTKTKLDTDTNYWEAWTFDIENSLKNRLEDMDSLSAIDQWSILDKTIHEATEKHVKRKRVSIHSKHIGLKT